MSNVFNKLGQSVLPKVFEKLSNVGLTDLMDIRGQSVSAGTGGGRIKSASPIIYPDVPVSFAPRNIGVRQTQGDKITSAQDYRLIFPTHNINGVRYNLDPRTHRLHVQSRIADGDEPAKVFRIISVRDIQGNMYEADCVREDV